LVTTSSYAAPYIPTGHITSAMILDGTILNADINAAAGIQGSKLADNSITALQIQADAVGASELANDAVANANIIDGTITGAKIATDTIAASNIAAGAIGASEIATGAVGNDELAADAVTVDKIAANAVGASEIIAGAVGTTELADDAVTFAKLNDGGAAQYQVLRYNGTDWVATGPVRVGVAGGNVSFYDQTPQPRQSITASRTGASDLALALMDKLNHIGLLTDSTVP
jgi:hypothetical protein